MMRAFVAGKENVGGAGVAGAQGMLVRPTMKKLSHDLTEMLPKMLMKQRPSRSRGRVLGGRTKTCCEYGFKHTISHR